MCSFFGYDLLLGTHGKSLISLLTVSQLPGFFYSHE